MAEAVGGVESFENVEAPSAAPAEESGAVAATSKLPQCSQGHALKFSKASAGRCDGCSRFVVANEPVMECRECNFYLCTTCHPIVECPSGHALHSAAAIAGACDACGKGVKQGAMVMDCRHCNWYLCVKCQPITQCPVGHTLQRWMTQRSGKCDLCDKRTQQGDMVMDCRRCDWYLCTDCHPQQSSAAKAAVPVPGARPLPQCPQGHSLQPAAAMHGKCDKCEKKIHTGEMVMDCRQCNWYLCKACQPITQCKMGHMLDSIAAQEGACDGCGKQILPNQNVMNCQTCNWYLCTMCHVPRV